jgi:hypothetical protein
MIEPTIITWLFAAFGAITFLPLLGAQTFMILKPHSQITKDMLIGKEKDWRDKTHFKSALAFAWADLLVLFPLFIFGTIGVLLGYYWGHIAWLVSGTLSIYFSVVFWILEKEFTYPSVGWLAYYTYYWGFFLYWGIGAVVYSILQISN